MSQMMSRLSLPFLLGIALIACADEDPESASNDGTESAAQESFAPGQYRLELSADEPSCDDGGTIDKAASCWVELQYCYKGKGTSAYCTKSKGCSCTRAVNACLSLINDVCGKNVDSFNVQGCAP